MVKIQPKAKYNEILLIDDNEIDNFINERMILSSSFAENVVVKDSAEDALTFFKNNLQQPEKWPEVIFLDLSMPIMDGFTFIENLKELIKDEKLLKEKIKIIILSSSINPADIDKASVDPLIYKYLNKPLSEEYLKAIEI